MKTRKDKPLSPHLTIYKPQITSVLSIMHRITGVMLFFGLLFLMWIVIFASHSPHLFKMLKLGDVAITLELRPPHIIELIVQNGLFKIFLVSMIYCIAYHFCAGIRYLLWSNNIGFDLRFVHISGWTIIFLSFFFTAILSCWMLF